MKNLHKTSEEPLFNLSPHLINDELLDDRISEMLKDNDRRLNKPLKIHSQMFYKEGQTAEYIFNMCEKLRQPAQVKYYAVELFNKFMVQHVYDLYASVKRSESSHKERDWRDILERVRHQVVLRVVTCCQVASKLHSHHRVVTPNRAVRTLYEYNHRFDANCILQSELRVLKTVNYRLIFDTPFTYTEAMLEIIGRRHPSLPVKQYFLLSTNVLDVVYIQRSEVYDLLFSVIRREKASPPDRTEFRRMEGDFALLAAAVVSAASFIHNTQHSELVIEEVAQIWKLNSNNIADFSSVIVQVIMQNPEQ